MFNRELIMKYTEGCWDAVTHGGILDDIHDRYQSLEEMEDWEVEIPEYYPTHLLIEERILYICVQYSTDLLTCKFEGISSEATIGKLYSYYMEFIPNKLIEVGISYSQEFIGWLLHRMYIDFTDIYENVTRVETVGGE